MAGVGEQRLVRTHQRLDARRGLIEAGRHRRHLVAATHRDPVTQLARAELLDALPQALQATGEAADHRPGRGRHRSEQQAKQQHQARATLPRGRQKRQWRRTR